MVEILRLVLDDILVYEKKDIDTIGFSGRVIMRNEINVNDGESVESSRFTWISPGSAAFSHVLRPSLRPSVGRRFSPYPSNPSIRIRILALF